MCRHDAQGIHRLSSLDTYVFYMQFKTDMFSHDHPEDYHALDPWDSWHFPRDCVLSPRSRGRRINISFLLRFLLIEAQVTSRSPLGYMVQFGPDRVTS